ncbi:MAG: hypothetical protein ACYC2H_09045 [Thermoplasmatota archaeon]
MRALLLATFLLLTLLAIPAPASAQDVCDRQVVGNHDTGAYTQDCQVVVSNKPYDCVWGGHWTYTTVGPVTYRSYSCGPDPA